MVVLFYGTSTVVGLFIVLFLVVIRLKVTNNYYLQTIISSKRLLSKVGELRRR